MAVQTPLNKMNYQLVETPFVLNELGDVIGIQSKTGTITYLPASVSVNAVTASTASDNTGLLLSYRNYRVTTSASSGDSLVLPASRAGYTMHIVNAAGANAIDVFPLSGEYINALNVDTAISVAANKTMIFICMVDGTWNTVLTT
jgi:uncharacterized membrane protein